MYLLDDSIRTSEDLEKYFGIVPLTIIPESDAFGVDDDELEERKFRFRKGGKKA